LSAKLPCGCAICSPLDPNEAHPPSIIDGVYKRSSPSQISTAELCALKWYNDKRLHLPRKPPSKGQQKGERGHTEIEHFANTGEDVRGPIALTGRHLLKDYEPRFPFNGGDIIPEAAISGLVTPGGVEVIGFMDLEVPPQVDGGVPEVVDHKFRSDIGQYGATEDELRSDPQAIIYGEYVRRKYSAEKVRFSHHQHQHKGALIPAVRVSVVLTADEIKAGWARLGSYIDHNIATWAAESDVSRIPHAPEDACRAFGGCDFEKVCPHSPRNRWANTLVDAAPTPAAPERQNDTMGLLSQMDTNPPTTPPPAAPAQPSTPAAMQLPPGFVFARDGKAETVYKLPDGRVAKFAAATPSGAFLLGMTDSAPIQVAGDALLTVSAPTPPPAPAAAPAAPAQPTLPPGAIFAKDAKQREAYTVNGQAMVYLCQTGGKQSFLPIAGGAPVLLSDTDAVYPGAPAPTVTAPAAPPAPASVLPPDAPKSNPAAPVLTKADAPEEEEGEDQPLPEANGAKRTRKKKGEAETAPALGEGLVLVVGGAAVSKDGKTSRDLGPYVAEIAAGLAKASNVPDVRCAGNGPLGFGAWKGAMAEAARKAPPSGVCHIYHGDLNEPVIEALAPLAAYVIRLS
jgi:hypothetical protein